MAPVIVWFRSDLRLSDNAALAEACASGLPVLPLYVHDTHTAGAWQLGAASALWLHHSLKALQGDLAQLGLSLQVYKGNPLEVLQHLHHETGFTHLYWNRVYEPHATQRDSAIKSAFKAMGVEVHSFQGNVLHEPPTFKNGSGEPFKVFTPFYKAALAKLALPAPIPAPKTATPCVCAPVPVETLGLLPPIPWDKDLMAHWHPGEQGANAQFEQFLTKGLEGYKEGRDRPDKPHTSRLSPHLHFGEISVGRLFRLCLDRGADAEKFLAEVGWRDFSIHLLYHFPHLPDAPLQPRFNAFPWGADVKALTAWQKGQTGYPIIDAGMRQLWQTGWMHNRVRMIVASFLVKHLLTPWQLGEKWFWDTLVDADLASNSASWQWVAGCGADAAPYFRVFNPVLQGLKFDPDGTYVRQFVPEIAHLPTAHIHTPWEAPVPPKNYPAPIIGLAEGRDRALAAFAKLKETAA